MLLEAITPLEIDTGEAYKDRQNSATRTAKEAAVEDILHIFKVMDKFKETELQQKPMFCIDGVSKLPPAAPEAVGSKMTLFEHLAKQQQEL